MGTQTVTIVANVDSFDADGFTLDYTTNTSVPLSYKFIAIGGDSVSAEVGTLTSSTSTGTQNVSTGIANANFTMMMATFLAAADYNTVKIHSILTLGMGIDNTEQGNIAVRSMDALGTSDTARYQQTDVVYTRVTTAGSILGEASFTGHTASGFDLNWSVGDSAAVPIEYLTIKGGQWEIGDDTTPTSATTKATTTSFQPKGIGIMGFGAVADAGVVASNVFTFGASDGTNTSGIANQDLDNVGTTDCSRYSSSTTLNLRISASTVTEEATVDSFNATDFTLDYTTADATARQFLWFAMGNT